MVMWRAVEALVLAVTESWGRTLRVVVLGVAACGLFGLGRWAEMW